MQCDGCGKRDGDRLPCGRRVKVQLVDIGSYRLPRLCQDCAAIEAREHGTTDTRELNPASDSFKQGWQEVTQGKTAPVSELWDGIDQEQGQ